MKKLSFLFLSLSSTFVFSQFVSPGTGVTYNLASLSVAAPAVLVNNGTSYQMKADITISNGDTLLMNEDATLKIDGGKQLTIAGIYDTNAGNVLITATDPAVVFKGIRLESTSTVTIRNTTFEYGGGIQALTGNFLMDNSIVRYFKSGLVTGAALNFSTGTPVVKNSQFIENDLPAVASGANQGVALEFTGNYLYGNTKGNSNRPQVNMGPSGTGITKIINNTIIGDRTLTKVGGVSVSTLLGVENHPQIEDNIIKDNRYGITVTGNNSSGSISNNTLTDNNTEPVPANGGSGISLSGSGSQVMAIKVQRNKIRGSLWGITIIGTARADLGGGTLGSTGENIFFNNGNGGQLYALYNNTANPISATNNCWREGELSDDAMVEAVISHSVDNATLGTVTYAPYMCALPLSTNDSALSKNSIYPNPSNGTFVFDSEKSGNIAITDMSGRVIYSGIVAKGKNTVSVKAKSGVYILVHQSEGKKTSNKLIIK
ncbi:MAG: T9SS type A sorting domain-containing protein [Weeksellaceae bacterium]|nr:T9SS type A sorting domain-containing protein [Bacteroidota bacterium]MCG2781951.1 T9SS type A sorting domain-containing protein [Weeksellaceae bacterium]